jgi:hypothetical protein
MADNFTRERADLMPLEDKVPPELELHLAGL